jgi:hypothetical protein
VHHLRPAGQPGPGDRLAAVQQVGGPDEGLALADQGARRLQVMGEINSRTARE